MEYTTTLLPELNKISSRIKTSAVMNACLGLSGSAIKSLFKQLPIKYDFVCIKNIYLLPPRFVGHIIRDTHLLTAAEL